MLALILYIAAFLLLLAAAFGIGYRRVAFGWLGLAIIAFVALLLPHFD